MNAYDETLDRVANLTFRYAADTISKRNFIMAMGLIRYDIESSNLGLTDEGKELVEAISKAVFNEINEVNA
jgi:predicted transcriptional regulator